MPFIQHRSPGCLLMMTSLEPDATLAAHLLDCAGDSEWPLAGAWRLTAVSVCLGCVKGERAEGMERDLPLTAWSAASLMNSSVTQLIAKPATDLALTSSPLNPTARFYCFSTLSASNSSQQVASRSLG